MQNIALILLGKSISFVSKTLNVGNGSTWPGHIVLTLNKNFIKQLTEKKSFTVVLVAGTNGKTTTSKAIAAILEKNGKHIIRNESGANLLNGVASVLSRASSLRGKVRKEYVVLEIDENTLPLILSELTPNYIILLNLFRDQLDRYGEVNSIAQKWKSSLETLTSTTTILLNADDPQIAFLGKNLSAKVAYFGVHEKVKEHKKQYHAIDSTYCPSCGHKLIFKIAYFSHLGIWHCSNCDLSRPKDVHSTSPIYPLSGLYNKYNINAATLFAKEEGLNEDQIRLALSTFAAAFGRQEKRSVGNKYVQIFLSKNPTSFNESLRTVKEIGATNILFVLNDRIPDGRDVSWIWDTDVENLLDGKENITVSGDRAFEMALRLKYALTVKKEIATFFPLKKGVIEHALRSVPMKETLFVIPTYSAMLEVRKMLTGKGIL